jgi:magnesium/cobalt transport protein CorA
MKIISYLFDADGSEREVELTEVVLSELNDQQILWVNILEREEKTVEYVSKVLRLEKIPLRGILRIYERPKIYKFKDFYHFFIISVESAEGGALRSIPIDFLVGKNYVVTVHDGDVKYLQDFVKRERGETQIGDLDAESFVATMLDLHIASYFRILERVEHAVDKLDEKILEKDLEDREFLKEMVSLRREVSKLRRWFLPHRDIFYTLSRPDFKKAADDDSVETFQLLNEHFESAVSAIESSRDTVLSLFDLYTTKSSHQMNYAMRRLTFITLTVGALGVIAGVFGMNFEIEYFKSAERGFWLTIGGMIFLAIGLGYVALKRRWI